MRLITICLLFPALCWGGLNNVKKDLRLQLNEESQKQIEIDTPPYWFSVGKCQGFLEALILIEREEHFGYYYD